MTCGNCERPKYINGYGQPPHSGECDGGDDCAREARINALETRIKLLEAAVSRIVGGKVRTP